jgi:hypothetical protein
MGEGHKSRIGNLNMSYFQGGQTRVRLKLYRSFPPYPRGICFKTPRGCLKPQIVLNPIHTMYQAHFWIPATAFLFFFHE